MSASPAPRSSWRRTSTSRPCRWCFQAPETQAVNAKQEGDLKTRITNLDERLADLDAMGLD